MRVSQFPTNQFTPSNIPNPTSPHLTPPQTSKENTNMTVTASPPSSPPQSTPQSNANPNNATDPLTTHLTSLITNYNHNFDYTSSLFYAHLLLHHNPSPTNLLLCARTEILAGNYGTALSLCTGVPGGEVRSCRV